MFAHRISDDIELRLFMQQDAELLLSLINANRGYLRRWMPWVDNTTDVDHLRTFIRDGLKQHADNAGFQAGIWYGGTLVGLVGMLPIDWPNHRVEIGYWLGEAYQGRGIITKACTALLGIIFTTYKLHRVEIRALAGNTRSRAVAERLGFHLDGILRQTEWWLNQFHDVALYSLLHDEWDAAGNPIGSFVPSGE